MSRASGNDRARRSNLVTTRVSQARHAAKAARGSVRAGQSVVDVDQVLGHTERPEPVALGGEILLIGGGTGVPDHVSGHEMPVAVKAPLIFSDGSYAVSLPAHAL